MLEQGMGKNNHETVEVSNGMTRAADSNSFDDDGRPKRTGNAFTASAHIITAVISSGALSMAWTFAQLGWVAGLGSLILFSVVTYYTSRLLTACYRNGNQVTGSRNYTYEDAVRSYLGGMNVKLCRWIQYARLFGVAIGYTISASISMMSFRRSTCYHNSWGRNPCRMNSGAYIISFAIVETLLSQIPDFYKFWWLSIVVAVMPLAYSVIVLCLVMGKVIGSGSIKGSLTGVSTGVVSGSNKFWRVFQALGNMAFACSYATIVIKIQDTIRSPPEESKAMHKAVLVNFWVTSIFFLLCGGFGYAVFGDLSPTNMLAGFSLYNPYWLLDIANVTIVVHLAGAFQVDCQPLFLFIENFAAKIFSDSNFITKEFEVPFPGCKPLEIKLFRLVWRSLFVICCTGIAMLPFSAEIVGLIDAIAYWPLTVYFPVQMYIVKTRLPKWSTKWTSLQMLSATCFVFTVLAAVGSIAD